MSPTLSPYDPDKAMLWMKEAYEQAEAAFDRDEVPVGCIVINPDGEVTGRGGDDRQHHGDPLAHAEVNAIQEAAKVQGDWRLDAHTLVVTLEPCPMCAGLALMARIGRIIYGASNEKWGASGTKIHLLNGEHFPHRPDVIGGIMAHETGDILSRYFRLQREKAKG